VSLVYGGCTIGKAEGAGIPELIGVVGGSVTGTPEIAPCCLEISDERTLSSLERQSEY
jgi:hypothetical protein